MPLFSFTYQYKTMVKLTNIRPLGRYKNSTTGKEYNIKVGRNVARGTDILFYLNRGKREIVSDRDFYKTYEIVQP